VERSSADDVAANWAGWLDRRYPIPLVQKSHFSKDGRLAYVYYGAAGLALSFVGFISVYRIENAGAF
jgi:hypothetical protein